MCFHYSIVPFRHNARKTKAQHKASIFLQGNSLLHDFPAVWVNVFLLCLVAGGETTMLFQKHMFDIVICTYISIIYTLNNDKRQVHCFDASSSAGGWVYDVTYSDCLQIITNLTMFWHNLLGIVSKTDYAVMETHAGECIHSFVKWFINNDYAISEYFVFFAKVTCECSRKISELITRVSMILLQTDFRFYCD
jgi:hypothetical protein